MTTCHVHTRAGSPGRFARYARSAPFPAPVGRAEQVKGILELESNGSFTASDVVAGIQVHAACDALAAAGLHPRFLVDH